MTDREYAREMSRRLGCFGACRVGDHVRILLSRDTGEMDAVDVLDYLDHEAWAAGRSYSNDNYTFRAA